VKTILAPEVEAGRIAGDPGGGPYGAFRLVNPETGRTLQVIVSDGRDWSESGLPGPPWEHVSACLTAFPGACFRAPSGCVDEVDARGVDCLTVAGAAQAASARTSFPKGAFTPASR
jgi:hypothetical protein